MIDPRFAFALAYGLITLGFATVFGPFAAWLWIVLSTSFHMFRNMRHIPE
jgi:hypothetical protein